MPDVIESIRLVRDPSSFEEAMSAATAGVGALERCENVTLDNHRRVQQLAIRLHNLILRQETEGFVVHD